MQMANASSSTLEHRQVRVRRKDSGKVRRERPTWVLISLGRLDRNVLKVPILHSHQLDV